MKASNDPMGAAMLQGRALLPCLAMAAWAVFAVPARAATFSVTTADDVADASPGDGTCEATPGESDCSLRAAVQEANALPGTDAIVVPAGVIRLALAGDFEDGARTGDLDITDDVALTGAGATQTILDAAGADRVLDVRSGDRPVHVTLTGVSLVGGSAGGVRALGGGSLTLRGCVVSGNCTPGAGGGIYVAGGSLVLERTSVLGNAAATQAGGIRVHDGTLDMTDAVVAGNRTTGRVGAGISVSRSRVTILRSRLDDNRVEPGAEPTRGGALFVSASTVRLEDTILRGNRAVEGDAIFVNSGAVTLVGTAIDAAANGGVRVAGGTLEVIREAVTERAAS